MHRYSHWRTRRGRRSGSTPGLKNFRANSVFRASACCSKTLNDTKCYSTWKISGQLCFSGQAQVAKNPVYESVFNTVKIFRANSIFQGKHKVAQKSWMVKGQIVYFYAKVLFSGQIFVAPPVKCLPVRIWVQ